MVVELTNSDQRENGISEDGLSGFKQSSSIALIWSPDCKLCSVCFVVLARNRSRVDSIHVLH